MFIPHGRDHLFERTASPFEVEQGIQFKRADLFERVLIDRITAYLRAKAGRLQGRSNDMELPRLDDLRTAQALTLSSGILFGALLDRRIWDGFYRGCCGPVIDFRNGSADLVMAETPIRIADRIWISLPVPGQQEKPEFRRWVADPITHFLLLRLQSQEPRTPWIPPLSAEKISRSGNDLFPDHVSALAHAFGVRGWDYGRQETLANGLFEAAVVKWRTRMPGFLIENLLGSGLSTCLPESHWERLLGKVILPSKFKRKSLPHQRQFRSSDPKLAIIDKALPSSRASRPRQFKEAAERLLEAAAKNGNSPVERYVLIWAACRLNPPIDPRQKTKRLAPSTIRSRAGALLSILRNAFGDQDPWQIEPAQVAEALTKAMSLRVKTSRAHDKKHLNCFLDWRNRSMQELSLEVIDEDLKERRPPRAGIITASEYLRILGCFDQRSPEGAVARILVMLGFRAGLRLPEAMHLKIDDISFSGNFAEAQIRDNDARRTKSLAGRRVLPLHCLFEEPELEELKAWWLNRKAEATAQFALSKMRSDHRLFPETDVDFHARIKRDVEHEIKRITGEKNAVFHVLRHSFATYLIATLNLPFDVPDDELVLPIDRSVVSHERRKRVSDVLLGDGRLGQNSVHAVGALLGHSGEHSTLVTYFHLHDWLAANYVSRPEAMRAIPTALAAQLLDMTEHAVSKAASRKRVRTGNGRSIVRSRGRPTKNDHAIGSVQLRDLVERSDLSSGNTPDVSKPRLLLHSNGEPSWKVLTGLMQASTHAERELIRQHAALSTPYGALLIQRLEAILAITTKGSKGKPIQRFVEIDFENRQRSVRQLGEHEQVVLSKLYAGFREVEPQVMDVVSKSIQKGYDRVRGHISVPLHACDIITKAFVTAGLSRQEVQVQSRARSALIRLGANGRMHRGYIWAILFACAAHEASSSLTNSQRQQK